MSSLSVFTVVSVGPNAALEQTSNCHVLVSSSSSLIVDAGYGDEDSVRKVVTEVLDSGVKLAGIALTHAHPDHVRGAEAIADALACPIYAHPAEPLPVDLRLRVRFLEFAANGFAVHSPHDWPAGLQVVHTPGHTHGHIALLHEESGALFTGDTVVGSGTVWVGPPDGHLTDYLRSLDQLLRLSPRTVYPGHGDAISHPETFIRRMKERRLEREADILRLLEEGPHTARDLAQTLYGRSIPAAFQWAALKAVQGHLQKLSFESAVHVRFAPEVMHLTYELRK